MYIYIYWYISSENLQLCIELTHENGTYKNDLIFTIYTIYNEDFNLTSSNKWPITYWQLFLSHETNDRIGWKI